MALLVLNRDFTPSPVLGLSKTSKHDSPACHQAKLWTSLERPQALFSSFPISRSFCPTAAPQGAASPRLPCSLTCLKAPTSISTVQCSDPSAITGKEQRTNACDSTEKLYNVKLRERSWLCKSHSVCEERHS